MKEELKFLDEEIINSILQKTNSEDIKGLRISSFPRLYKYLDEIEIEFIKKFSKLLKLNPRKYGFEKKFPNLIIIKNQKYNLEGEERIIGEQYLPVLVYIAFWKMNKAIDEEIGKKLLIASGYRSPAYQTILFLYYLKLHKFNFLRTTRGVAFPGDSEHEDPVNTATDLMTIDGAPHNGMGFEKTEEYKWLTENANEFGFYLSYPRNNGNFMYEPWHWRWMGKINLLFNFQRI